MTPRKIAAARAAALSFFPPLASLTARIVAAAFWRSTLSVICGERFFFLPGDDFFDFLPDDFGDMGAPGRFDPSLTGFSPFFVFPFPSAGCPYIDIGPLGGP